MTSRTTTSATARPRCSPLDVANGQVLAQCKSGHRHQEFLAFLKRIEATVPASLEVHLIVDNYCIHKHAMVRAWLAERPRFHVHYTPTYASWLSQVERWFGILSRRGIRRGSFTSARRESPVRSDARSHRRFFIRFQLSEQDELPAGQGNAAAGQPMMW
jgi:transposase